MDRSILKVCPLLIETAMVLGQRSLKASTRTLLCQLAFSRSLLPFKRDHDQADMDSMLRRIDDTRAHLREIAEIISQEARAMQADLASIADRVRLLAEEG